MDHVLEIPWIQSDQLETAASGATRDMAEDLPGTGQHRSANAELRRNYVS